MEHDRNERSARPAPALRADASIPCVHGDIHTTKQRFRGKGTAFRSWIRDNPDRSLRRRSRAACPILAVSLGTVFPAESNKRPCYPARNPLVSPLWESLRDDVSFVWKKKKKKSINTHRSPVPNPSNSSTNSTRDSASEARVDAPS